MRASWRRLRDRGSLRTVAELTSVDEDAICSMVPALLEEEEGKSRGAAAARALHDRLMQLCGEALAEAEDQRLEVARSGFDGLYALQVLGKLEPCWLPWRRACEADDVDTLVQMMDEEMEDTFDQRLHALHYRCARRALGERYGRRRKRPEDYALPSAVEVAAEAATEAAAETGEAAEAADASEARAAPLAMPADVIDEGAARRLRESPGLSAVLVLDPQPALLPPEAFATATSELFAYLTGGGANERNNPCSPGAKHGALPLDARKAAAKGFGPEVCALVAKLASLPHLVARFGWHRPLLMPPMVQIGYYEAGSGAYYQPHLDRQPDEEGNHRELTFLLYLTSASYAPSEGGCLRLHPGAADGADAKTVDVEPLCGRVVVFRSADQRHEVRPSLGGVRLALSLWVEYEEAPAARSGVDDE